MKGKEPYGRWAFTGGADAASLLIRRLLETTAQLRDE
jgi:hypothetical protein